MEEKSAELPVSEQEVQIQPPSILDKLKIHKFKILGAVLGILVFTGAVFGAYEFSQKQVQPAPKLTLTPTPRPEAGSFQDETADWDSYTNTEQGYSIKFPRNKLQPTNWEVYPNYSKWEDRYVRGALNKITVISSFDLEMLQESQISIGIFQEPTVGLFVTLIGVETQDRGDRSLEDWVDGQIRARSSSPLGSDGIIKKEERVTKGGIPSIKLETAGGSEAYLERGRKVYAIKATTGSSTEYKEIFDLMLSSFEFLEGEMWTYKGQSSYYIGSDEAKFTLQYPTGCESIKRKEGYGLIVCEGEDYKFTLDPSAAGSGAPPNFEILQIKLRETTWEKRSWKDFSSYMPSVEEVGGLTFLFTVSYEKYSMEGEKLAEQILSTFRFLE